MNCLSLFLPLYVPSPLHQAPEAAVLIFLPYGSFLRYSPEHSLFLASTRTVTIGVHEMLTLQAKLSHSLTTLPLWSLTILFYFFQDNLHLHCYPLCLSHFHTYYIFTALFHRLLRLYSRSLFSAGNDFMIQPMAPEMLCLGGKVWNICVQLLFYLNGISLCWFGLVFVISYSVF